MRESERERGREMCERERVRVREKASRHSHSKVATPHDFSLMWLHITGKCKYIGRGCVCACVTYILVCVVCDLLW